MALHARVPWPMEPERERLKLLEAKVDLDFIQDDIKFTRQSIDTYRNLIESSQKRLAEDEKHIRKLTRAGAETAAKLAKLSTRR